MEWIASSPADLPQIAQAIIEHLGAQRKMVLIGEMGAGKTTFTKAFCAVLGVADHTSSPTFSLINAYQYTDANGQTAHLHHLDLYRLRSANEAFDIGVEEVLYDPWYCLIEWPQVIEQLLPNSYAMLHIQLMDTEQRLFRLVMPEPI